MGFQVIFLFFFFIFLLSICCDMFGCQLVAVNICVTDKAGNLNGSIKLGPHRAKGKIGSVYA